MSERGAGQISAREQARLGLPPGWRKRSALPFAGLNLSDSRFSIQDAEFAWLENWIRIGSGRLQVSYDIGPALHQAAHGKTIQSFAFFTLNATDYFIDFHTDGSSNQVQVSNGAVTAVAGPGTFGPYPATAQWGTQYLLISDNASQSHYWAWDGKILYGNTTLAPGVQLTASGSGYTSLPTVSAYGGSGSGAILTPQIDPASGTVTSVLIDNPGSGWQPGEVVQLQFQGGGSDDSAVLQAQVSGQAILSIEPVNPGGGYTSNPSVTVTGGGGSVMPVVTGVVGSGSQAGQIVQYVIETPGSADFTSTPSVNISGGGGSGASAAAVMTSGVVSAVVVLNPGTGFSGTPGLKFQGGGGSGAAAVAIMSGGTIASVEVINGGQGYINPPAVIVDPGINGAAAGNVSLMPNAISGSDIDTYLSRVVLVNPHTLAGLPSNGGTRLISAPGSFTDFATSDGGLIAPTTESALLREYTGLQISGGYLYFFGDTSISVLSQITTSGSPTTTTLNYQTLDTQSGTPWRDSIQSVGRDLVFANESGVWRLYGGTPTKLSEKIDPIFAASISVPNAVMPTAAVTTFMSRRIYLLNKTIFDPRNGEKRTILLGLDEGRWHVFSQSRPMTYIATQQNGATPQAYGTDGTAVWPLMAQPSSGLIKTLSSKQWGIETSEVQKQSHAWFAQMAGSPASATASFSVTVDVENESYPIPVSPSGLQDGTLVFGPTGDVIGSEIGFTFSTAAPNMQLLDFGLAGLDVGAVSASM